MLFHLAAPSALIGIALALIIGVVLHDTAQVFAARLQRDPTPKRSGRLTTTTVSQRVSPFSVVAMVIVGNGWAEPVEMNEVWRKRRFHVAVAILAGPLAYLLLTVAALGAYHAVATPVAIAYGDRRIVLTTGISFGADVLLWMAVTFGSMFILSLIPVPPLDGGRVLFLLGPQSPGWRKAHYQLTDTHIGIAIILAILLLPVLFSGFPSVTGQLVAPLLRGLGGLVGLTLS